MNPMPAMPVRVSDNVAAAASLMFAEDKRWLALAWLAWVGAWQPDRDPLFGPEWGREMDQ